MTMNPTGAVYKLHGSDDPWGPIGLTIKAPADVATNRGRMSATVTFSREAEDRSGDIVVIKGIRLDGHKKNPVVLLNHNKDHVVGYCQDRLGSYTVKTNGDRLVGEVFFCQDSQLGVDTFRAVEARILRGTSIGFLPVAGKVEKRNQRGTIYHASDLIEGTITGIGDNEDAIVEAVHKTFKAKPPAPELAAILPGLNYKTVLVPSGWDAEAVAKRSTYRSADPMEMEPQYRSPTYYNCPHCSEEVTHEHLYRDGDHTRHGACGGRVVMKPVEGGTIAIGTHPKPVSAGNQSPNTENLPVKTLGQYIAKRIGQLRRKGIMDHDTMNGGAADEFAPVDDPVDPTADPNAQIDPHAAHKQVTDQAMGDIMASIYEHYCNGTVELKAAGKQFMEALKSHAKLKHPAGEGGEADDDDADGFGDDDDFGDDADDFDDDLSGDDGDDADDDSDSDADSKPDIGDKKKKAEKAVAEIWTKSYAPTMTTVADGLAYILEEPDPDGKAVQRFVRKLLRKMQATPEFDGLVTKALEGVKADQQDWPPDWSSLTLRNGTH